MPNILANGIQIEYDTFGDRSLPPLLLINGLGSQMIRWEEEFCEQLSQQGFFLIRFDNRDVGLSTKFEEFGVPNVVQAMAAVQRGEEVNAPYTLDDMAADAVGLLDALGIEKAHICGVSMGGMIAQIVAIRYPSRVLSLVSIMSHTGNPELPRAKPEAMAALTTPVPEEREAYIEHSVKTIRIIGNPGFPFTEERIRERAAREYDRAFYPPGAARQLMAVIAASNREHELASLNVPAVVIHGADDPLVPVEGGKATAAAIPEADLLIIEGMGHDVSCRELWPRWIDAIVANARKATG
ncbi:MAG: alpha/beta fold hydrolase [Deltaproteobacteria bacterium]|nr:alpha/beta fold hydrolase [Deltaproteobacteria bacterium]